MTTPIVGFSYHTNREIRLCAIFITRPSSKIIRATKHGFVASVEMSRLHRRSKLRGGQQPGFPPPIVSPCHFATGDVMNPSPAIHVAANLSKKWVKQWAELCLLHSVTLQKMWECIFPFFTRFGFSSRLITDNAIHLCEQSYTVPQPSSEFGIISSRVILFNG